MNKMNGTKMNVIALCCAQEDSSLQEEGLYPADKNIISALKKIDGVSTETMLYDETELAQMHIEKETVVFNLCDSFTDGRKEGEMVEVLEKKHISFTGNKSKVIFLCMDKIAVRQTLQDVHLPVPVFFSWNKHEALPEHISFPVIVKPAHEHGSVGIDEDAVVFDRERLQKKLSKLADEHKGPFIVEQYIDGKEYCMPIIGNSNPTVLPILEIDYSEHFENRPKILSYKAKWSKNSLAFKDTYSRTARISEDLRQRLELVAKKVYQTLGMCGYGTVDVRVDSSENIYVIDVNANSYVAPESDMAKAAAHINISYPELLNKIIHFALAG